MERMTSMGKTNLSIKGRDFYINGKLVYDEIEGNSNSKGLLMNARFIQGIFDDKSDRQRFNRFNKIFEAFSELTISADVPSQSLFVVNKSY